MQLTGRFSCSQPLSAPRFLYSLRTLHTLLLSSPLLGSWLVWSVARQLIMRLVSLSLSLYLLLSLSLSLHICVWSSLSTLRAGVRGVDSESDRVGVQATRSTSLTCHSFILQPGFQASISCCCCWLPVCQPVSQLLLLLLLLLLFLFWPGQNKTNKTLITIYMYMYIYSPVQCVPRQLTFLTLSLSLSLSVCPSLTLSHPLFAVSVMF